MRFGTKLLLCIIMLLTVSVSAAGSLLIYVSFAGSVRQETENAVSTYTMARYSILASGKSSDGISLPGAISTLSRLGSRDSTWYAVRFFDKNNTYYSDGNTDVFDDTLQNSADGQNAATMVTQDGSGHYILQISGIIGQKGSEYYLEIAKNISPVYDSLHSQQNIYYRIFAVTLLCGGAAAFFFTKRLTAPLINLASVSRRIAGGELQCRAEVKGRDEIAKLSADFNEMAVQLTGKIDMLQDSVRRQQEFVGAFAHEMKTPMTSIIGYADLIRSRDISERERQKAANYIFTEGRRLEKLSAKLLDLLVLQKRDFPVSPCSPAKIIKELAKMLVPVLNKNNMVLYCSLENGTVLAEPDLLRTVIINLIDNARKAMPDGGEVRIKLRMLPDGCSVSLSDTGIGIPAEEIAKLTEAFYRVDKSRSRAQGGVGLGLAICNEIIDLHGGEMKIESEVGHGTTVSFTVRRGRND